MDLKNIDAIDKLLFLGILIFTALLMIEAKFYATDGQTFQVISGLLTGFSGAFLARIKPKQDSSTTISNDTSIK